MTPQRSIDSVQELYQKLVRTFDRRADYCDYQVDWVFDCAVTAWHLVDWVAINRGVTVRSVQKQLKIKCPELTVCEQVCNGAKHLVLDNAKLKPFDVTADVRGTDALRGIVRNVYADNSNVDIVLTPVILIIDKSGKSWEAIELFHKVLRFWDTELRSLGLM
jgi:hypothetical protein